MVEFFCGNPGSGKSLHSAQVIREALERGDLVISNFEINVDIIKKCKNKDCFKYFNNDMLFAPDIIIYTIIEFFKDKNNKNKKVYVLLDECQTMFDSRSWSVRGRKEWLNFFAQHRKYNTIKKFDNIHIILITQNIDTIDKRIRGLVEYRVEHTCITNIGNIGFLLKLFLRKNIFRANTYWNSQNSKNKIDGYFFTPKKKYFEIYNTLNTFNIVDKGVSDSGRSTIL
ncbi:MAG: zonular occludens toxin domain-containing protein [Acholeplasmatales bacterium]|nr:zonular occludens toxin domain-containing protein [Acholeplasmatales bacterium]